MMICKRIIGTSSGNQPYNIDQTGEDAFSHALFGKLKEGHDVKTAFEYARSERVNMGYPPPQIDDGSGGMLASGTFLKGELSLGLKPVISEIHTAIAAFIVLKKRYDRA